MVTRLILFEGSLLLVAWLLAWMMNLPLRPLWQMDAVGVGIGWTSTLPPAALFFWMIQSSWEPFAALRRVVQEQLMPLLGEVSFFQIILLSALAGIGEEVLFRGVIEGGLTSTVGRWPAMMIAALLFGLCHALTPLYFFLATMMGLYLSLVWMASDQLISPIITHAAYDLLALGWYVRQQRRS